MLAFIDVILQ